MKQWTDEIAKENFKVFKTNAASRAMWERDAIKFEKFRYGTHFSQAEEEQILAFRQAPLPISYTTAICDTAEAYMLSSKPVIKVAPLINPFNDNYTEISKKVAEIYTFLLQKSWYDSLGTLQYDRVIRDSSNVGHGLFYVVPRNEYGEFNVDIKHISWKYFYPDSNVKDPFYRGMDNCVVAMEISIEQGYKYVRSMGVDVTYEKYKEDWVKGSNRGSTEPITDRYGYNKRNNKILFITRSVLEEESVYIAVPKNDEVNTENSEMNYRVYMKDSPEFIRLAKEGKITWRESKRFYLTEYISIGSKGFKNVYPITQHNIIPLVYDHRDNPYPTGRVWYLYPLQRAINKFVMVAVLNGSLTNSLRVLTEKNSVVDKQNWMNNFATPGAMLEWQNMTPGVSKPPMVIEGRPLSDAWLQFPKYLAYIMEYVSGIFGTMMGDSSQSPDVFSTVASLQSAGGIKIKRRQAQSDAALSIVGEVTAEFYKEYAPPNGYSTTIDDNGDQQPAVVYNRLRKSRSSDSEVEIDPNTDLSKGFHKVRFTTQSSNGFEAGTEAALLTNLATQLKVPELLPLILKRINIADVDKVMAKIDTISQQNSTIQQMAQQIKDLESNSKLLANQVQQKMFEASKAGFDGNFKALIAKIKNDPALQYQLEEAMNGNGQTTSNNGQYAGGQPTNPAGY